MKRIIAVTVALIFTSQVFAQNYSSLHNLVIKFYGYQRAGLKDGRSYNLNNMEEHKGDNYNGSPLDGGWYDAGDYIKFGMPLSYTVYCLLKGYDIWPSSYEDNYSMSYGSADGIPDILNEVKFATDYLMKAVINENTVILDVGNGGDEHDTWGVKYGSGRSGGQIHTCSGADIPATYSACLALMSTLYRKHSESYADSCLEKAKTAFSFAKKKYDAGQHFCNPQPGDFYSYKDDQGNEQKNINERIAACGVELYRASDDSDPNMNTYETWARKSIVSMSTNMGYSFIGPLASFEVWRQGLGGSGALSTNIGFITSKIHTSGSFKDVYQNSGWGTARDVPTAAMEFGMAYVTTSDQNARDIYLNHAKNHIKWVTGDVSYNNYNGGKASFVIGHGSNYPTSVHYRPTYSGPRGGVVSGPGPDGAWYDGHENYQYTEVALDYNAGIAGAVAFLKAVSSASLVTNDFTVTPSTDLDLSTGKATIKAGFSKSVSWKITILGGCGTKTLSGNGSSINAEWDGSADEGYFLGGEEVIMRLELDENIPAIDIVKIKAKTIRIEKAKKIPQKDGDVVVDDFEDSDTINVLGGNWITFSTSTSTAHRTIKGFANEENSRAIKVTHSVVSDGPSLNSGIKATFNSEGTPVSLGSPKSIYFDLKASHPCNVRVELEQQNILDTAYYGAVIPVTTAMNSYRLEISDFFQPDWKTADVPLDLNNIVALRFTVYDSVGMLRNLFLDNVAIEDLTVSGTRVSSKPVSQSFRPLISSNVLTYNWVPNITEGAVKVSIFNIAGRRVISQSLNPVSGKPVSVSLHGLPKGIYTAIHTADGKMIGKNLKLTVCE